ncbi:hypothetical protein QOZ80_6AG0518740 [Eleusine coracana subsp. coracana]|nr:hypothetical protein QOZ80_6AG0518740 [Eleusine coracana subsp. coracana]
MSLYSDLTWFVTTTLVRVATMSPTLLFFCLLLLPHLGTSDHFSYTLGSRQLFIRSSARAQASVSAPATCWSVPSGVTNDRLPVVHRLSQCWPPNDADKSRNPSASDVYLQDVSRIRSLFAGRTATGQADVQAPAPAPSAGGVTLPTKGTPVAQAPGVQDYTVLVGYGTPAQTFPMGLETSLGLSLLRCKPCAAGSSSCDPAFDTTKSSTFTRVPCGSPNCRSSNCSGSSSVCPLPFSELRGEVVQDVLTLTPSSAGAVQDFTFGCVAVSQPSTRPVVGVLDLSRDSRSVASRLATPGTPAFSYCLPLARGSSRGFLSIGANRPNYGASDVQHAPLVLNPDFPNMYFIDLVGMSLGGKDIPIPPSVNTAKTTALDVVAKFTHLNPAVYVPLRDAFREDMKEYPTAPPFHGLDTCYNFTGLNEFTIPLVRFKFGNGESFLVFGDQMLYYEDPTVGPFSVACLAFTAFPGDEQYNVIGSLAQTTTEVVYDVSGGKVGFIPFSC